MRIPLCGRIQARRLGWPYQPSVLASSAAGLIRPTQPTFSLAVSRRTWLGSLLATLDWCVLPITRSEEHTSELQSLMRISYAGLCLKKKQKTKYTIQIIE